MKIALTGNIAAGKSLVENQFKSLGVEVIDADKIAHQVLEEKIQLLQKVFGSEIIKEGSVSRVKLGKIVFSNSEKRRKLEKIIHPFVKKKIEEFLQDKEMAIASIPLLYEVGWEDDFDKVVLVIANDNTRLKRIIERDGVSKEDARLKMASQKSQGEKMLKADFIIDNNGSKEETFEQVKKILDRLK